MNPERWKRAREIFEATVEQAPEHADAFLRAECGNDSELVSEVRRMLEEHGRTGALDHGPWDQSPKPATPQVFCTGQLVAERYRIIRFIAGGGMGEVYEGRRPPTQRKSGPKDLVTRDRFG